MGFLTWDFKISSFSPITLCYLPTNIKKKIQSFGLANCPLAYYFTINSSSISKSKYPSIAITHAKKRNSPAESPIIQPTIIDEVSQDYEVDDDELLVVDDDDVFEDDELYEDEDYFEDEYEMDNAEVYAGDGAEGGGIKLAGTWWDKETLTIAEDVTESFDGDLGIYAFRTLANATIQVRVEKLSTKD